MRTHNMYVKLILPALTEARSEYFRSIKYSLFPPLGLVTLASYVPDSWNVSITDEHVETLDTSDTPDIVGIEVYITAARRSYEIADAYRKKGCHVVLGGLHVTALPKEAMAHADTIITGPAEEAWPRFLSDFKNGVAAPHYRSATRTLEDLPPLRRELIKRSLYLVPNSLVTSRGCPHRCDFCYSTSFFKGGRSYYSRRVDQVLAEIEGIPGRHLFFLDDNILGDERFALALFEGMRGMNRACQGAATLKSLTNAPLLDAAARAGMRSLFIGFESLNRASLEQTNKHHNDPRGYNQIVRAVHDRGIMINGSFVFGLEHDRHDVFDATVDWAIRSGLETATFHILTPYPGTPLFHRMEKNGRLLHRNWDLYDTRHAVTRHPHMSQAEIEAGYWRAYRHFYSAPNIVRSSASHSSLSHMLRHMLYTIAWKKCDPIWQAIIQARKLPIMHSLLERVLGSARRSQ